MQAEFDQDTASKDTIRRTFQRFCKTGTVEDHQHSRRSSMNTEEKIDEIRDVCATESNSSVRGVATACSIPQTTTYRIMIEYLSLKAYQVQFVKKRIYDADTPGPMETCQTLIPILEDSNIQENVFSLHEVMFHLNGFVNKHNIRY